jgi:hypothetical protein
MRALFIVPIAIALSGCGQWVVFGHTYGGEPAAQQAVPPQPTPAPQPAAPGSAGAQSTGVAPSADQPRAPETPPRQPTPGPSRSPLKGVTVTLALPAQEQAATDGRLKEDAVAAAIESELRAHKLLAEDDAKAERTMAIVIDDFAIRPTSNTVIFGYVINEGTLTGTVDVHGTSGQQLQTFQITAKSRLVIPASGEDDHALRTLYNKFANLTVDKLSAATSKPDDVTNNEAPR